MRSARLALKYAATLLLIAAACGKNGGPTDSDADQPPVKVIFLTTPAGATVYFDGDSVGVTCPEDVGGLAVEEVPWGMQSGSWPSSIEARMPCSMWFPLQISWCILTTPLCR